MANLNSASAFASAIQGDDRIVVKFHADWCTDCKRLDQHFDQITSEFPQLKFHDVDVEQLPEIAEEQGVRGIPSLLVYRNGEKIAHLHSGQLKTPQQAREFLGGF